MFEVELTYYRAGYVDHVACFEEPTVEAVCDRLESETEESGFTPEALGEAIRDEGCLEYDHPERPLTVTVRPVAVAAPDLPQPCQSTKGRS